MTEPQPNRGFEWTQAPWGARPALRAARGHAPIISSPRENLTLRDSADEWDAVAASDRRRRATICCSCGRCTRPTVAVASADRPRPWPRPDADAIVSNDPDGGDRRSRRRLRAGAAGGGDAAAPSRPSTPDGAARRSARSIAGVEAMQSRYGVRPERLLAAVGPSIGPCCYEVGDEHAAGLSRRLDTIRRCSTAGSSPQADGQVPPRSVAGHSRSARGRRACSPTTSTSPELCTKTHADVFHSYRVEGRRRAGWRMIGRGIRGKGRSEV